MRRVSKGIEETRMREGVEYWRRVAERRGKNARKSGEEEGIEEGRKERSGRRKKGRGRTVAKEGKEKRIRQGVEYWRRAGELENRIRR